MSKQDQAVEIIRTWQKRHKTMMDRDPDWAAQNLAIYLREAGLIAPELPDESWPQVWEVEGFLVAAIEDGGETIELAENEGDGRVGYGWFMDRHLARNLAHALLAAAQYAEEE